MDSPYQQSFVKDYASGGYSGIDGPFNQKKGELSRTVLGPLAENALQASPQNPASNSAQKGEAGSNKIKEAYQAVNKFWQGNPEAPFIESLGSEDQAKLQELAVKDPEEYYRELERRKGTFKAQKSWQDLYGPKGTMRQGDDGGGRGGGGGDSASQSPMGLSIVDAFKDYNARLSAVNKYIGGGELAPAGVDQSVWNADRSQAWQNLKQIGGGAFGVAGATAVPKREIKPWEFEFSGLGMGIGRSGGPVA